MVNVSRFVDASEAFGRILSEAAAGEAAQKAKANRKSVNDSESVDRWPYPLVSCLARCGGMR
jgi:hypothetical protein